MLYIVFFLTGCATLSPKQDLIRAPALEQEVRRTHPNCLISCPVGAPRDNIVVDHDAIILSSNKKTKFADWVAYKIIASYIEGPKRKRIWQKDPKIEAQFTFVPKDYKNLTRPPYNFDRGHQAPLGSLKNHDKWYVVNYLSNITPQARKLNQGSWNDVESEERKLVKRYREVYVLTGPYYDKYNTVDSPLNRRIKYMVPSGYWKVIAVKENDAIKTVSFIFPQKTPFRDNFCKYLASLSQVEKMTGLKLFGNKIILGEDHLANKVGCFTTRR